MFSFCMSFYVNIFRKIIMYIKEYICDTVQENHRLHDIEVDRI